MKSKMKFFEIDFWIKELDEKGQPIRWARRAWSEEDLKRQVSKECGSREIIVKSIKEWGS